MGEKGFLLIKVETSYEHEVMKKLEKYEEVKSANIVYGPYDIVAKVETGNIGNFAKTLRKKIGEIYNILPLVCIN